MYTVCSHRGGCGGGGESSDSYFQKGYFDTDLLPNTLIIEKKYINFAPKKEGVFGTNFPLPLSPLPTPLTCPGLSGGEGQSAGLLMGRGGEGVSVCVCGVRGEGSSGRGGGSSQTTGV